MLIEKELTRNDGIGLYFSNLSVPILDLYELLNSNPFSNYSQHTYVHVLN